MNWLMMFTVLGAVVGGAMYVWLLFWGALRLGSAVGDWTGSEGLNFGAYWITIFAGGALPFAIAAGLTA